MGDQLLPLYRNQTDRRPDKLRPLLHIYILQESHQESLLCLYEILHHD